MTLPSYYDYILNGARDFELSRNYSNSQGEFYRNCVLSESLIIKDNDPSAFLNGIYDEFINNETESDVFSRK